MGRLSMVADLRLAFRQLARSPGFTLAAILTLGLGIGACTAAYSLARGMLWAPMSFPDADRLVVLHSGNDARGIHQIPVSYLDLKDARERSRLLTSFAALAQRQAAVGSPDGAERVIAWRAEPAFFRTVGVAPMLGRTFAPDEGGTSAQPVTILSYNYWTRRFGRDTTVIGRTLTIDGITTTVIGVMPKDFLITRSDLWLPLAIDPTEPRDARDYTVAARLAPGATLAAARSELATMSSQLASTWPATNRGWGFELFTYRDDNVDAGTQRGLMLMMVAVALVLAIACANVAGLMIARGAGRARELAVRAAIGADRGDLLRHALTEAFVLAVAGGGLGLVIASWSNDLLLGSLPVEDLPTWLHLSLDVPTLVATAVISLGSILLFGLLPAIRASRPSVVDTLKGSASSSSGTRLRSTLVVAQVGLAVTLLAAAAIVSQSFIASRRGNLGFDDRQVTAARVFFGAVERGQRATWMRDALEKLRAMPGVEQATLTGAIPGDDGGDHRPFAIDGQPVAPGDETMGIVVPSSDGFLQTLGVAPLAGRWFTPAEAADRTANVAVVGARMAKRFWPAGDAVGHRVRALPDTAWRTIVGIVPDLQYEEFGEDAASDHLQLHVPYGSEPWRSMSLLVRGNTRDLSTLVGAVQRTAAAVRPDVPVFDAMTMSDDRRYTTAGQRAWLFIFGGLGFQALLMTAVGLYGLLAYSVEQRRREIGVRMALGAAPRSVVRMVVGRSAWLTLAGLAAGLAGAIAAARILRGLMWGVEGTLLPVAVAATILLLTAMTAALLPARRAARVDPMNALRSD